MKNILFTQSKKRITILVCLICMAGLLSFTLEGNPFSRLDINQRNAELSILNNLVGSQKHEPVDISVVEDVSGLEKEINTFKIPSIRNIKDLAAGDNTALAEEICQFADKYLNSEQFKKDYEEARQKAKPTSEPFKMSSAEIENLKSKKAELEKAIKEMKAAKLPQNYIETSEKGVIEIDKIIAENSDPTPNLTKWKKMYPENPETAIRNKAQEYLSLEKTVDYQATLTPKGNKKVFSNPAYESKSLKWKAIYRAGKDVNQVFIKYATAWSQ